MQIQAAVSSEGKCHRSSPACQLNPPRTRRRMRHGARECGELSRFPAALDAWGAPAKNWRILIFNIW